jgi:hypothetical protein
MKAATGLVTIPMVLLEFPSGRNSPWKYPHGSCAVSEGHVCNFSTTSLQLYSLREVNHILDENLPATHWHHTNKGF